MRAQWQLTLQPLSHAKFWRPMWPDQGWVMLPHPAWLDHGNDAPLVPFHVARTYFSHWIGSTIQIQPMDKPSPAHLDHGAERLSINEP